MDNQFVLSMTSDLKELENDMKAWSRLPYEDRLSSEKECKKRYGMCILQLYKVIKSGILSKSLPTNPQLIDSTIREGSIDPMFIVSNPNKEMESDKEEIWNTFASDPNIVVIRPYTGNEYNEDIENMNDEDFQKYIMLTPKFKRISDQYSLNLYGYNVRNIYTMNKAKFDSLKLDNDSVEIPGRINSSDSITTPVIESMNQMIFEDDKIGLLSLKLDSFSENIKTVDRSIYENEIIPEVNRHVYHEDYIDAISYAVPYFTLSEMNKMDITLEDVNNDNYHKKLEEAIGDENKLLSLGWNPSVQVNETSLAFARNRQCNWLKNHVAKIIDITKLKYNGVITESSSSMKKLYKEYKLFPIYIVLSYTNTIFGKVIRTVQHSTYTHAGLSLDSDLSAIATFKYNKEYSGFSTENLKYYIDTFDDAIIKVLCIFVDENTKIKVDTVLKDFFIKRNQTRYGFGNLFNILFKKSKEYDPENLALVCSQFCDTILKLANINITDKSSNLVSPKDFEQINSNPKVYKVYEGLAKEYNEKKVEDSIYMLFKKYSIDTIKYIDAKKNISEGFIDSFFVETENEKANEVLREIQDLLTPQAVIYEKKFPIGINDKGDITIELYKSLEQQYQEAHKLLKTYNEENLEGIKHELARLYYVNFVIEKKIKKTSKDNPNYKKMIDLRARVLNDFKKYFKIVIAKEPNFDFSAYFQKSEYYNGNIIIDNAVVRFTGKLIEKFLKSLGV